MRAVIALVLTSSLAHAEPRGTLPVDPVELVAGREIPGDEKLAVEFEGYRYLFANQANRDTFLADTDAYRIQWGGACAGMGPLSGAGDPKRFAVAQGHIYIFASDGCRKGFLADPDAMIERDEPVPEGTPAQRERGAMLLRKAVRAAGAKALANLESVSYHTQKEVDDDGTPAVATSRTTIVIAGGMRRDDTWARWTWGDAFSPEGKGFSYGTDTLIELAPDQCRAFERLWHHQYAAILAASDDVDFVAVYLGEGEVDGAKTERVATHIDGVRNDLDIDPQSGRILRLTYRGRGPGGVLGEVSRTFVREETVNGFTLPTAEVVRFNGRLTENMSRAYSKVEVNPVLPETFLTAPNPPAGGG